jgi:hypothetical protein
MTRLSSRINGIREAEEVLNVKGRRVIRQFGKHGGKKTFEIDSLSCGMESRDVFESGWQETTNWLVPDGD